MERRYDVGVVQRDVLEERLRRGEEELFRLLWRAVAYYKDVLSGNVASEGRESEMRMRAASEVIRLVGGLVVQYSKIRAGVAKGYSDNAESEQRNSAAISEISGWVRRVGGVG